MRCHRVLIMLLPVLASLLLIGCAPETLASQPDDGEAVTETEDASVGLPNPATVYCVEQGGEALTRTDADGGSYGVCVFANCTECEEWAFYRGECEPGMYSCAEQGMEGETPVTMELAYGWRGYVESLPDDPRYDDKLVLCSPDAGALGIKGCLPEMDDEIAAIRDLPDPHCKAHFWGRVVCGIDDYNGCQFVVERMQSDEPGLAYPPDPVEGWSVIMRTATEGCESTTDVLVLAGDFPVCYGVQVVNNDALEAELDALIDTETVFQVWGELSCGIVDVGGCQIRVDRIEIPD